MIGYICVKSMKMKKSIQFIANENLCAIVFTIAIVFMIVLTKQQEKLKVEKGFSNHELVKEDYRTTFNEFDDILE